MKIEFATSANNPAFRIYRLAGGSTAPSFIRDAEGPEQLVIFDGDEGKSTTVHHETTLTLQKLSEPGRRLVEGLFALPLCGIYIAIDQAQLVAFGPWSAHLHRGVTKALRRASQDGLDIAEITWEAMMADTSA